MRSKSWLIPLAAAAMLFTTSFATSAAPLAQRRPAAAALLPLTEADKRPGGVGCSCTFVVGGGSHARDLLMLARDSLVSRTRAGANVCPMRDTQVALIATTGGTARCGTRRITIRTRTSEASANNDWGDDATVTIRDGKQTKLLHGAWACAC